MSRFAYPIKMRMNALILHVAGLLVTHYHILCPENIYCNVNEMVLQKFCSQDCSRNAVLYIHNIISINNVSLAGHI